MQSIVYRGSNCGGETLYFRDYDRILSYSEDFQVAHIEGNRVFLGASNDGHPIAILDGNVVKQGLTEIPMGEIRFGSYYDYTGNTPLFSASDDMALTAVAALTWADDTMRELDDGRAFRDCVDSHTYSKLKDRNEYVYGSPVVDPVSNFPDEKTTINTCRESFSSKSYSRSCSDDVEYIPQSDSLAAAARADEVYKSFCRQNNVPSDKKEKISQVINGIGAVKCDPMQFLYIEAKVYASCKRHDKKSMKDIDDKRRFNKPIAIKQLICSTSVLSAIVFVCVNCAGSSDFAALLPLLIIVSLPFAFLCLFYLLLGLNGIVKNKPFRNCSFNILDDNEKRFGIKMSSKDCAMIVGYCKDRYYQGLSSVAF